MAAFYAWVAATASATISYATMPAAVPGPVAVAAHQSIGAAYLAAGTIATLGHQAVGQALHLAATNAFLRGLTIGCLVAGGAAAAGALLAVVFLPARPPSAAAHVADGAETTGPAVVEEPAERAEHLRTVRDKSS